MPDYDANSAAVQFVDALVDVGAQLATILHHQPGELEVAADVLSTAATAIEENLFLVPPPADPPV